MARIMDKKYHELLYELLLQKDKLEQFKKDLDLISKVLRDEPNFKNILEHPDPLKEDKKDMIKSVFKNNISQQILIFLCNLIDKGMESEITQISDEFNHIFNEEQGIIEATAFTAVPMNDNDIIRLRKILSEKLKKKIILSNKIDTALVGGVLLKVGDKLIDGSLKGRLDDIHNDLNNSITKI